MKISKLVSAIAATAAALIVAAPVSAGVFITEFNSNSGDGGNFEFVEFTNLGPAPQSMAGWSQDDSTRTAKKSGHLLDGFNTLAVGESAIFTEANPDAFRVYWWGSVAAAPAGLKIVGPYSNDNLSSSGDEVNLYDSSFSAGVTTLFTDRLTYNGANGGSANGVTRNGPLAALGLNQNINWLNSSIGDSFGSFAAAGNTALVGNPGTYTVVPEPASAGLLILAGGMTFARRRRA